MPQGTINVTNLPIREFASPNAAIRHFLDILHDVPKEDIDADMLKGIFKDKAWGDLPYALKIKGHPNFDYKSQFFILTQSNGKLTIVKHFFLTKAKLAQTELKSIAVGTCYEIVWGSGNKVLERKAFQWMLEQMGGLQFRQFSLTGERKRSASSAALGSCTDADQDAGWDYIIEHGERDRGQLKQLRWILEHINQDGSPIRVSGCLGKTPLARVTAMMFSRYHGGGQFRSAEDFDFFRGIFFSKATPALYDDGDISGEAIKQKKAFSDVGNIEGILKEPWNAAKFVQGQLRIVIDNTYAADGVIAPEVSMLSHDDDFIEMIRPAIGYISDADSRAILKRSVFMVFTNDSIYYRPPSERPMDVRRHKWALRDILVDECEKLEKITFPFDLLCAYTTRAHTDVLPDILHRLPCCGLLGCGAFLHRAKFSLFGNNRRDISNELDFKHLMKNKNTSIMWEQWVTLKRAPGPGAIRRIERKQIGTKLLKDRNVVLHTDSAKSYKLVIPRVIHDRVVHCRKRVKKNGEYTWMQPKYVSIVKHTLPKSKKILSVKSGTQVIDRCWRFLKDRIHINQHSKAGSRLLRAKLRAAQCEYWYRNTDLWIKWGERENYNYRVDLIGDFLWWNVTRPEGTVGLHVGSRWSQDLFFTRTADDYEAKKRKRLGSRSHARLDISRSRANALAVTLPSVRMLAAFLGRGSRPEACAPSLTFQFADPVAAGFFRHFHPRLRRLGDFNECWERVAALATFSSSAASSKRLKQLTGTTVGKLGKLDSGAGRESDMASAVIKAAKAAWPLVLKGADRNGDGKLTQNDVASSFQLQGSLDFHDLNEDGEVTQAEFESAFGSWLMTEAVVHQEKQARKTVKHLEF
ncbi:unnamed protein product [Symbiodinium microadriaticum]|nr:unnamed protein product [Symbiodinium microadriaticum]